ncbi:coiled-coil domain-containing protein 171-like [Cyanistes caeruleus]|uniref:coiled-coil domain-containing protein 171-like n=1 Tax=Cyanistes caeruleus TaxID=156563 RepID=UPI000CDA1790|nr:coiled-coil domain-containing protein 171-like [Cyanistes caeruleus]
MLRKLRDIEVEHHGCSQMLKLQANRLDFKEKRQERLIKELEAATVKTKKLEENAEAARLAHIECKYTTEIMQLRIQELEDALNEEQGGRREAFTVVAQEDFRESENAQERRKKDLQRQPSSLNVQCREGAKDRNETEEPSGRLVNAATSFSLHEGPEWLGNFSFSVKALSMEGKCGLFPIDRSKDLHQRVFRFVGVFSSVDGVIPHFVLMLSTAQADL